MDLKLVMTEIIRCYQVGTGLNAKHVTLGVKG